MREALVAARACDPKIRNLLGSPIWISAVIQCHMRCSHKAAISAIDGDPHHASQLFACNHLEPIGGQA